MIDHDASGYLWARKHSNTCEHDLCLRTDWEAGWDGGCCQWNSYVSCQALHAAFRPGEWSSPSDGGCIPEPYPVYSRYLHE